MTMHQRDKERAIALLRSILSSQPTNTQVYVTTLNVSNFRPATVVKRK